jgi:hypothetical protein
MKAEMLSQLWEREREFWLGGVSVYREHLAGDSLMVFPGMVLSKSQTEASIAGGPRWTSVAFADQRLVPLTPDVVALVYRASASREGEEAPYSAVVSSVYVRQDGSWKLALHQQSPEGR